MYRSLWALAAILVGAAAGRGEEKHPPLLQKPTLGETQIAFVYAGDLWIAPREGGDARRLTSGVGVETDPYFSPDGSQIAFTGEYQGNVDVYVVPAAGGVPRRLTYHPGRDEVVGWTPDGKRVLFRSDRANYARITRLYTIGLDGSYPQEVPLATAFEGSYAPDALRMAYVPYTPAFRIWKRYRGGRTTPVWIANLEDSHVEKVPRENSNDFNPMWVGEKVYFLSDRSGPMTLFVYDPKTKEVNQVLENHGLDIKAASPGPGAIAYEQFGTLSLFDLKTNKPQKLDIRVAGDLPEVRTRYEKIQKAISSANISPTGVRAVFGARGDIITVPVEKGSFRNLTNTPGVCERDPAWSPNGKWIAYFSDESGEYALHVRDQRGQAEAKKFTPGDAPSFYYSPVWSPDSKKIAYTDKRLNLWYLDTATGKNTRVDTDSFDDPVRSLDPSWSPDSKWIAYTRRLKNHLRAVFVFDLEKNKSHQVTDGMSDARFAVFDKNGKYLYFTASTDAGPTSGWLDLSSFNRSVTSSVYVAVLRKDVPSPLAPESDEENASEASSPLGSPAEKTEGAAPAAEKSGVRKSKETPAAVRIDLDGIDQRILALPVPAHNYQGLEAGKPGTLFLLESSPRANRFEAQGMTLHRFDLQHRKADRVMEGILALRVSHNGEKMLYRQGDNWFIASTAQGPAPGGPAAAAAGRPGGGMLKLDEVEVLVDPRAEWRQMYHEVWRIERDFLYDPNAHGLDLRAAEEKYRPYLDSVASRQDLNYLFGEMLGELSLGHTYVNGGDAPQVKPVRGGLLGADYRVENGRYRFARIYRGENWNPEFRAPLTQPGVNVKEGDYLLAVNGRPLRGGDNLYSFFEATAGKAVTIKVGSDPEGKNAREVTVVPVPTETPLRHLDWVDANRRTVDKLSGGKVAYIYLPDTSVGGYRNFNRYYFAQLGKEGAVIDERFNGGGFAADYIIDYMRRPLLNYWSTREGADFTTPYGSIYGPKAMIINESAGSGGDAMPWYFRRAKIGPLVGTRTWGGLVGIYDYPELIDGGRVTAPRVAFWNPEGQWEVENHGVAPDVEVELDPELVRKGRDPQLEKAVQLVMEELEKNPPKKPRKPAYPNYHERREGRRDGRPDGDQGGR